MLSRIVRAPGDEHLPEEVREKVIAMCEGLTMQSFLRDPKKLSDNSFSQFSEFITEFEMQELWTHRLLLWRLP
jgi:hypothetical protein